jgi:hypothetical protein
MFIGNYSHYLLRLNNRYDGKLLEDIPDFIDRIRFIISQNKNKIKDLHDFAKVIGSLDFLEGIEYHYSNFINHLQTLASKDHLENDRMLDHEAIAYLHLLGQFYYFAKSLDLLKMCPTIKKLYLFRKKYIGHRSIDSPNKDDSVHEQIWQTGCFLRRTFSGPIDPNFDYKNDLNNDLEIYLTPRKYLNDKAFITYQIISNNVYSNFIPQIDHPVILKEIENAYILLFANRK